MYDGLLTRHTSQQVPTAPAPLYCIIYKIIYKQTCLHSAAVKRTFFVVLGRVHYPDDPYFFRLVGLIR